VQTFFDDAVRERRATESAVLAVFAGWSYDEIWLPAFDYLDLFARGLGAWAPERTCKFVDRAGHLLALRPDFTSLVARTVATRFGDRPRPIRVCYSGEVFRWDEPRHGRQNEFHQIGIEYVGAAGLAADFEILVVACEALGAAGVTRPVFTLSHAGFHRALLDESGLGADEARAVLDLWRRRSTGDLDRFLTGLGRAQSPLGRVPELVGAPALAGARDLSANPRARAAIADLDALLGAASSLGMSELFGVDLGDIPALDYYTGVTFRIFAAGLGTELGSGGRYDELLGKLGQSEPAVGMVLFLDSLIAAAGHAPAKAPEARSVRLAGDMIASFAHARRHRAAGERIRLDLEPPGDG
jgi:ATP phosphoribosyltransferase regulatory subunit